MLAHQFKKVKLRELIKVRVNGEIIKTSTGRIIFNKALPESFEFVNKVINAGKIKELVKKTLNTCSRLETKELIDCLKDIGFEIATISGLSVAVSDCKMISEKDKLIQKANKRIEAIETDKKKGLLTEGEKSRLFINVWMETTEEIADKTWQSMDVENPVKMIVDSGGTRASKDQIKQLSAMRGLVVDPLGNIVELPTKSNFREGLSIFEYVTSTRGSRKGLTDSALKTADAGYLTRRLVDVSHSVIIREKDCGICKGIIMSTKKALGRVLAESAAGLKRGKIINEENLIILLKKKIKKVMVRSALTCKTKYGICAQCYGWDWSIRKIVEIGTPVGVIAAQSIGEPGTQLTLRVKHTGGIVGLDVTQGLPRVEELFEIRKPKVISPIAEISGKVKIKETEKGYHLTIKTIGVKPNEEKEYLIPLTSTFKLKTGDLVSKGEQLSSGSLDVGEILAVRGLAAAQKYLLHEVRSVYESQGITINDKHFEVIIRKMSDLVKVITSGDTAFLPGELVNRLVFNKENERVKKKKGITAKSKAILLGITRSSLQTDSWLSAASFQETTKVLSQAAIRGKEDHLIGLKENVIIGRLIPVSKGRAKIDAND